MNRFKQIVALFIVSTLLLVASPSSSIAEQQLLHETANWKLVYDTDYQECVAYTESSGGFNFGFMYDQQFKTLTFRAMPQEPIMVMGNTELQVAFSTRTLAINEIVGIELGHAILPLNKQYIQTFIEHSDVFSVQSMYTGWHRIDGEKLPLIIKKLVDTEGC